MNRISPPSAATIAAALCVLLVQCSDPTPPRTAAAPTAAVEPSAETIERGRYLAAATACGSCHTRRDRPDLAFAGGRVLRTPFGTFNIPNITPDRETGIGNWSDDDFVRAVQHGSAPDGSPYYPVFPYRWYQHLTREDVLAIKTFLFTLPPIANKTPPHDLSFPFSIRSLVHVWKLLNMFTAAEVQDHGPADAQRGSYLVNAAGHCGACHTPTDFIGNFRTSRSLSGNDRLPGGYAASNITSHSANGIGAWSDADVLRVLQIGVRPDGTPVRGTMAEFVTDSSSHLSDADRRAIVAYLRTLAPRDNAVARTREKTEPDAFDDQSLAYSIAAAKDLDLGRSIALMGSGDFSAACFRCHGAEQMAASGGVLPRLDGQSAPYLEKQLADYAAGHRQSPVMEPIARALGSEERRAVAGYYALRRPPFEWSVPQSPARARQPMGRRLAETGDFARALPPCMACHDAGGTGFAPSFPYLAGQYAAYTEAQFALWRMRLRRNDPLGVMQDIAAKLSTEEVRAVANYYQSIGAPAPGE